jgi:hypothetical protein
MATLITDHDLHDMRSFPVGEKEMIMRKIMSRVPVEERSLEGNNDCVKTLLNIKAGGLRLIDLQPQETVFTSIWYCRHGSLLSRLKPGAVAMLVWESNGVDKAILKVWHI